jgi:hypothetical protein
MAARRFADAIEAAILASSAEPSGRVPSERSSKAHVAEGNVTEARRSYRAYRDLLYRELCVVPTEDFPASLGISEASPARRGPAGLAVRG